ncbi:proteasome subunit beta [Candidatus Woesearchaeota archaeon]|nr:MAG: proteasome subunit beta [Candidatus Woesearchaeota archaeon]RLE44830.1 MAG: proteasome subunit beta [Candidatus Woesearchaeota archaeon]
MEKELKTGTTTLGLLCKDGIVLAADKRATAGHFIAAKKVEKIVKITDEIAVTTAGTVSDIQLLVKIIRAELKLKEIRTGKKPLVKEAASLLAGLVYENIRKLSLIPGISQFIVAGVDVDGFHLYDVSPDGSITEIKDFVSTGSGSELVYGLLEASYKKDMLVKDAIKLAIKSINSALQRDSASGDGIDVYTITDKGVKKVLTKEIKIDLEKS